MNCFNRTLYLALFCPHLTKPRFQISLLNFQEKADSHLQDYDPEIFDDDDFYHQVICAKTHCTVVLDLHCTIIQVAHSFSLSWKLLRELIERRTSTNTDDPVEMGR